MYKLEDYTDVQSYIELLINNKNKEYSKNDILDLPIERYKDFLKEGDCPQEAWKELVEEFFRLYENIDIVKLGRNRSEIRIPTNRGSSWKNYESRLKKQGWNLNSIETLKKSTVAIRKRTVEFRKVWF